MPTTSSADMATEAAIQLTDALLHPAPASPFSVQTAQIDTLRKLAEIFDQALHLK